MTKNLLTPAAQLYTSSYLWRFITLLFLLSINTSTIFAQKEQLIKKGFSLNDIKEANVTAVFANGKTIFPAINNEISRNSISGLWLSDGTEAGTTMVKNFDKETEETFFTNYLIPSRFFNFNNKVFMNIGHDLDESINYLYVSDGTDNGTFKLLEAKVAKSIYAVYHSKLYIGNGAELLTSDGTKAGTVKVTIPQISNISSLFTLNDRLIIETASSLYAYNDQTKNLVLLSEKKNASTSTKDFIFFVGKDGDLWKTNGTPEGTSAVIHITEGADLRSNNLISNKKYTIFHSYTDANKSNTCLWFSDGFTTSPMKDNKGQIVSTDTTGYSVLPTKFDEKIYFYLSNVRDVDNHYLFVFNNNTASAKFLKNMAGFAGSMFPFTPKVNNSQEYLYATPEGSFFNDYMNIKGFNATTDSLVTLTRILTASQTSWFKSGNTIFFSKTQNSYDFDLYVQGACNFEVKINTPDGTNICKENSVRINLSVMESDKPLTFYKAKWLNEKGTLIEDISVAHEAGNYTVYLSNASGCMVSAEVNITKSDSLSISIAGNNSFCPGQSTTLIATLKDGIAPYTYQWKNGTNIIGTNTSTFNANTEGNYSVIVKDSKGCQGIAPAFAVKQQALPDVHITKSSGSDIVSGGSTTLSVPASVNQTYQWFKDGTSITGATSNTYTVKEVGKFSVAVNANGCSASSEIVIVNLVLANELIPETVRVEVFPNPTDNLIKLNITEHLRKAAQIKLLNMRGTVMKQWETMQQDNLLNISDLSAGEYLLKIDFNNQSSTKKIIKLD
ncbi:T9SS type A sorting domain-containing protein [Emticicia fontis]